MSIARLDRSNRGVKVLVAGIDKTQFHDSGAYGGKNPLQTVDATLTTLLTIPTRNNVTWHIKVRITGRKTDNSKSGGYEIIALFNNNAGVLSQVGATIQVFNQATDAAWTVAFAISGTNILVQVTGKVGDTINWTAEYEAGVTP